MIQRIQSIYLLVAALLMVLVLLFPTAIFTAAAGEELVLSGISAGGSGVSTPWGIAVFAVYSSVMALAALFSFKNRRRQLRLAGLTLLGIAAVYIFAGAHIMMYLSEEGVALSSVGAGMFLPVAAALCVLMARRAIRRDEDLVRAADRIR